MDELLETVYILLWLVYCHQHNNWALIESLIHDVALVETVLRLMVISIGY